jgi:hypothetical protein
MRTKRDNPHSDDLFWGLLILLAIAFVDEATTPMRRLRK